MSAVCAGRFRRAFHRVGAELVFRPAAARHNRAGLKNLLMCSNYLIFLGRVHCIKPHRTSPNTGNPINEMSSCCRVSHL
ncbi:hypothetical protein CY34DRAFT_803383, partial [Suillus luteus UH-Slu-Lm8-n1]